MSGSKRLRERIAVGIISVFLSVTVLLVICVILGLTAWADAKEILQAWSGTYSFLVGSVIGFYFRPADPKRSSAGRSSGG